jgi:hypothetical protein
MWRRGRRSKSPALVPVFGLTHPHIFSLSAPRTRCNFVPLAVRCSRSGHKLAVVPANAGTHNHRLEFVALAVRLSFQQKISRGMGPCGSRRRFAPPHHEDLAWRRLLRPRPEERACARLEGRATQRTTTQHFVLATHGVRVLQSAHPRISKRAQGMPGAGCTHGPRATKKHAAEPQVQPEQPAFPAQWF